MAGVKGMKWGKAKQINHQQSTDWYGAYPGKMVHVLKCHCKPFSAKWHNLKNWEIRKNDRNYKVGDILIEREFAPLANNGNGCYGSNEIHEEVLWILPGGYGLESGYIIMSTKQIKRVRIVENKREEFTEPYKKYEN